jgi:hypothetical protein
MGSIKDTFAGRGRWRRFTDTHRCVVCGRSKTCSVTGDGSIVWCKSIASETPSKSGIADGWLHFLDDTRRTTVKGWSLPEIPLAKRAGSADVLDAVYRELLGLFPLEPRHRAGLEARGLTAGQIEQGLYRSLPPRSRHEEGERLAKLFNDGQLAQVPGLFQRESHGRRWWTIGGNAGLLVPVRDIHARIVGLKIRLDEAQEKGGRYRYLSSSTHGGAKADLVVHVPTWVDPWGAPELRVTEGELKADVASALLNSAVIGIPGVKSWELGRDAVLALKPTRVIVAMDMDRRTNADVGAAQEQLVKTLRAAGLRVGAESWDPRHKGLDDALLAKRRGAVAA